MTNHVEFIRDNAGENLNGYEHIVQRVAVAYANRDAAIVDDLIQAGVGLGATRGDVEGVLRTAGLLPEPVENAQVPDGDLEGRVARIEDAVNRLTRLAQDRLGIRV